MFCKNRQTALLGRPPSSTHPAVKLLQIATQQELVVSPCCQRPFQNQPQRLRIACTKSLQITIKLRSCRRLLGRVLGRRMYCTLGDPRKCLFAVLSGRRRPESNRCRRLCRPLRSHSATSPKCATRVPAGPEKRASAQAARRASSRSAAWSTVCRALPGLAS
jgi:hypothetical protein